MDHLLYIAMSGAKENMNSLAIRSTCTGSLEATN